MLDRIAENRRLSLLMVASFVAVLLALVVKRLLWDIGQNSSSSILVKDVTVAWSFLLVILVCMLFVVNLAQLDMEGVDALSDSDWDPQTQILNRVSFNIATKIFVLTAPFMPLSIAFLNHLYQFKDLRGSLFFDGSSEIALYSFLGFFAIMLSTQTCEEPP